MLRASLSECEELLLRGPVLESSQEESQQGSSFVYVKPSHSAIAFASPSSQTHMLLARDLIFILLSLRL